jgi:hypothetical protein
MAQNSNQKRRHLVLLWMAGGPSQIDTFDPKPDHANGGPVKSIATSVPGVHFSQYLPQLAERAHRLAVVRSLNTQEGDHQRGTFLVRTGHRPGDNIRHPCMAAALAHRLCQSSDPLPSYVSIGSEGQLFPEAFSPGYLGPEYAPTLVAGRAAEGQEGFANLEVRDLRAPGNIVDQRYQRRWELWQQQQQAFMQTHLQPQVQAYDVVYRRAYRMMNSAEVEAFDLAREPDDIRQAYGRSIFGQGCLLARRLIERGVPVVEVTLGPELGGLGWDTHQDNFKQVEQLCAPLDQGWSRLLDDLAERDLLANTTVLWIGEFGRTPQINNMGGRDHFPQAWSCVLAGGRIHGGQVYGATSADAMEVVDGKVGIADILATVCQSVGVDPHSENISEVDRPFKIADGQVIAPLLAGSSDA